MALDLAEQSLTPCALEPQDQCQTRASDRWFRLDSISPEVVIQSRSNGCERGATCWWRNYYGAYGGGFSIFGCRPGSSNLGLQHRIIPEGGDREIALGQGNFLDGLEEFEALPMTGPASNVVFTVAIMDFL